MGMTVVSLATSIPEISAHLTASMGILRGTLDFEIGSAIVLNANTSRVKITSKRIRRMSPSGREAIWYAIVALGSMAMTVLAAQIVLSITERVVVSTGIGGSLIGVITLGLASALPELTTAISGIKNKEQGISLGTLVGSNITNPLVAIGGGALVSTYWVPRPLVAWDLPWETLTGLMLWGILWFRKGKLGRGGAIYLIALYFVYLGFRAFVFSVD